MNASDDTSGGGGAPSPEDFGRKPGFQDNDAGMADMLAAAAATPDSKHQADEDAARRWLQSDEAKSVMGRTTDSALLVESPQVFQELAKAPADQEAGAAVAEATERAIQATQAEQSTLAAEEAARQGAAPAAQQAAPQASAGSSAPSRPMELERQLSNIQMGRGREHRLVVQGDEALKIKFYAKLEGMGKLRMQGGTPVINMSLKDMSKVLQEVAQKNGAVFQPVAQLEFSRSGGDWTKDIVGGIKDALGRQHRVQVFAVGDQATVDKKVAEVSSVIEKMGKAGLLEESSMKHLKDGVLQVEPGKLLELRGSQMLDDMVGEARANVHAHKAHEAELDQARKDFKNKETDDKMAKAAEKAGEVSAAESGRDAVQSTGASTPGSAAAAPAAGSMAGADAPPTPTHAPLSPYVQKAVDGMSAGFQEMGNLSTQPEGKKQIVAESLLNQVRTFNGKDSAELNKLTPEARQTFVTQLALTAAMADTGTFGRKLTTETIDRAYEADPAKNRAASPSIREKIGQLVDAERGDPQFEARAAAVLNSLEAKGIITHTQAAKAFETLAPGKELPEPTKETAPAAAEATVKAESSADAGAATKQQDLFREPPAAEAAKASTQEAIVAPAELRTLGVAQSDFAEALPRIQDALKGIAPEVAKQLKNVADNIPRASSREDEVDLWKQGQAAIAKLSPESVAKLEEAVQAQVPQKAAQAVSEAPAVESVAVKPAPAAPSPEAAPAEPVKAPAQAASQAAPADAPKAAAEAAESSEVSAPKTAVKTSALVEKIAAVMQAGPAALSREDASSVIASLEGRQASKLATLDARGGNLPTQTLERLDGLLKEVASGRHGDELASSARNLVDALEKWKGQDAQRLSKEHGLTPEALDALRTSLRKEDGAWHGVSEGASASTGAKSADAGQAGLAQDGGKSSAKSAEQPAAGAGDSSSEAAKASAAERYSQTELAAGKLASMMNNPAGAFTNKDKSWNERNVDAAASAVMRVDVDAARTMSQNQRNQIAAYAAWMADNANSGRLPGFDGPEGKARAQALTARATALVGAASGKMPASVNAQLVKADRMVGAMHQRTMAAPRRASTSAVHQAVPAGRTTAGGMPQKPSAAAAAPLDPAKFARDLGHAVFKEASMTEPYAKYLVKNAGVLTSDVMKGLSPTDRAQAAVGLAHLAQEVRGGALGEFKDLSPTLQRQVVSAQQVANKLQTELSANPDNRVALAKAFMDLQSPAAEKPQPAATQAAAKTTEAATPKAQQQTMSKNLER